MKDRRLTVTRSSRFQLTIRQILVLLIVGRVRAGGMVGVTGRAVSDGQSIGIILI